jgi:predicted membrane protein
MGVKIQGDLYVVCQYLIQKYTAFFFVIVLCLVMGVVLLAFFAYHLYLVLKNTTSNERMKRLDFEAELAKIQNETERHRFEEELKKNIYSKGWYENLWEVIESK